MHWLTDLAGAVPTPLRGCDKFSCGFPRPVFQRLIKSIPFVQRLAHSAPVDLFEAFLRKECAVESIKWISAFLRTPQRVRPLHSSSDTALATVDLVSTPQSIKYKAVMQS